MHSAANSQVQMTRGLSKKKKTVQSKDTALVLGSRVVNVIAFRTVNLHST